MKTLITILLCLLCGGCMIIWSDHVFVATLLKTADANDLRMRADPNYLEIGSGQSKTRNDPIRVIPPYMIETGNQENQ